MRTVVRLCDAGVFAFGWFTIITHASVLIAGLNFSTFRWLAFTVLPAVIVGWRLSPASIHHTQREPQEAWHLIPRIDREFHLVIVGLLTLALGRGAYELFWIGAVALLILSFARSWKFGRLSLPSDATSRTEFRILLLVALLAATLTLAAHFPDSDDGFLLNMSVSALDRPETRLLSTDGIHNIPGIPLILPTYKSHSLEILYAWIAWLVGAEPIAVAHIVFPPLSAVAAIFSAALLLRVIVSRAWLWALIVLVVFWSAMGDASDGFARHAFVRLFQGKAVMVTALIPYLAYCVIRHTVIGGVRSWLFVLACAVSATGLSATGLFVAPLALGAMTFAAWQPNRHGSVRSATMLTIGLYPLAVAMVLRPEVIASLPTLNGSELYGTLVTFSLSLERVVGSGIFSCLQLGGILASVALAPDFETRRWLSGLLLVYFLVALNPFAYDIMVNYLTSAPVAWRLLWIAPLPHLVAAAFAFPLSSWKRIRWQRMSAVAFTAVTILVFGLVPWRTALSPSNVDTGSQSNFAEVNRFLTLGDYGMPRVKAPPNAMLVEKVVRHITETSEAVLAPREIDIWLTVLRRHPRVVATKNAYLQMLTPYIGTSEAERRMRLLDYVSGVARTTDSPRRLASAIDELRIGTIIAATAVPWWNEIDSVASRSGRIRSIMGPLTIWHRPPS
jgi:hypothetical protein